MRRELVDGYFAYKYIPYAQKVIEGKLAKSKSKSFDLKESEGLIDQNGPELDLSLEFNINLMNAPKMLPEDVGMVTEIGLYLRDVVIENFVREMAGLTCLIYDGQNLSESMHEKGINMRYLGLICSQLKSVTNMDVDYFPGVVKSLISVCEGEMVSRSVKHLLRAIWRHIEKRELIPATVHILKCVFENVTKPNEKYLCISPFEQPKAKLSIPCIKSDDLIKAVDEDTAISWRGVTSASVLSFIHSDVERCFVYLLGRLDLPGESFKRRGIESRAVLRRICQMTGIQVKCKDYYFDPTVISIDNFPLKELIKDPTEECFLLQNEDILSIHPRMKVAEPSCADADKLLSSAKQYILGHEMEKAIANLLSSASAYSEVCGPLHPRLASCYTMLASAFLHVDRLETAIKFQRKALLIYEMCLGIDHHSTIGSYKLMGSYCFRADDKRLSIWYFNRARHLLMRINGHNSPR